MQTGGSDEATPYINITPLIDVLLVLLIIFMVVSPLKPSQFEAKVPAEPKDQENKDIKPNPLSLVVDVDKEGKIRLNKDEIADAGSLGARLSEIFQTRERNGVFKEGSINNEIEKTVFVKAPKALKYGEVVRVIDSVKGAGATPIGLQIDDLQ